MIDYKIIRLVDRPQLKASLAQWFHQKWSVAEEAYAASMDDCLQNSCAVPQWYCVLYEGKIIGGLGVIENDFHTRKDLTPNICAVYVEKEYRQQGIAGKLLALVCADMKSRGVDTLYLLTDHVGLYEKYGWRFLCMVQGDDEAEVSRMYVHIEG